MGKPPNSPGEFAAYCPSYKGVLTVDMRALRGIPLDQGAAGIRNHRAIA